LLPFRLEGEGEESREYTDEADLRLDSSAEHQAGLQTNKPFSFFAKKCRSSLNIGYS